MFTGPVMLLSIFSLPYLGLVSGEVVGQTRDPRPGKCTGSLCCHIIATISYICMSLYNCSVF